MGIADKVSKEIMGWGMLGIIIVIMSIVLLKFKTSNVGNMTCASGFTFNGSANNCYETINASNTTAIGNTATFVDTVVSALSEPANWVSIAIIALIGIGLLYYFKSKKNA